MNEILIFEETLGVITIEVKQRTPNLLSSSVFRLILQYSDLSLNFIQRKKEKGF